MVPTESHPGLRFGKLFPHRRFHLVHVQRGVRVQKAVPATRRVQDLQALVRTNRSFRLAEIDLNLLFAECPTYSEQGLRLKHLFREAEEHSIVLFFDEGHRLCNDHGSNSVANIVKPLVTNPRLQLILATTCEEYQRYIATGQGTNCIVS